jgi:hypothetical protein
MISFSGTYHTKSTGWQCTGITKLKVTPPSVKGKEGGSERLASKDDKQAKMSYTNLYL